MIFYPQRCKICSNTDDIDTGHIETSEEMEQTIHQYSNEYRIYNCTLFKIELINLLIHRKNRKIAIFFLCIMLL